MRITTWEDFIAAPDQRSLYAEGGRCGGSPPAEGGSGRTGSAGTGARGETSPLSLIPLALTIGVFDGVHRGHQALLEKICSVRGALPAVITFRQNPLRVLSPKEFPGDIYPLERKLALFEEWGVGETVLIDFSTDFGIIKGRNFIDLLINNHRIVLFALGRNFRCGHGADTGVHEIQEWTAARGIETWIARPVMEGGEPVSSSRIRKALAAGDSALAERLLGRPV